MLVRFLRIVDLVRWNALRKFYRIYRGPFVRWMYAVCMSLYRKTREYVRIHLPVGHGGREQSKRVTSRATERIWHRHLYTIVQLYKVQHNIDIRSIRAHDHYIRRPCHNLTLEPPIFPTVQVSWDTSLYRRETRRVLSYHLEVVEDLPRCICCQLNRPSSLQARKLTNYFIRGRFVVTGR